MISHKRTELNIDNRKFLREYEGGTGNKSWNVSQMNPRQLLLQPAKQTIKNRLAILFIDGCRQRDIHGPNLDAVLRMPQSVIPSSPMMLCKRSSRSIAPLGCMLKRLTWAIASGPTNMMRAWD